MTDIKMPGMDGIGVLKRIKALEPTTEVIVVTGHGDMELAVQALNLSATDFINKPVQKEALEAALKRAEERIHSARKGVNDITIHQEGDISIMDIQGNVTSLSEPFLKEAWNRLIKNENKKIVLRFDENATINGAGIALLTQLLLESSKKGQVLAISRLKSARCSYAFLWNNWKLFQGGALFQGENEAPPFGITAGYFTRPSRHA